tara:strand:+ start:13451 stop:13894 length:444 start_codon:yes stop_codon:yes gene_type:complete
MKSKLFFFIISFILLSGCVAKKTSTEYKEIIKRDSTYFKKDRIITPRVVDTLYVDSPCDSVTGKLKDFEKEIITPQAKVKLKSVDGNIEVALDIEAIVQERIKEFKQNYKSEIQIKEVEIVILRTPLWVWGIILLESLVIFLLIRFK